MSFDQRTADPGHREAALNLLFFANNPRQSFPAVPPAAPAVPDPDETSDEEAVLLPSNLPPKRLRSRSPRIPSVSAERRRLDSPDSDSSMEDAVELSVTATPTRQGALPIPRQRGPDNTMSLPATSTTTAQDTATTRIMGEASAIDLSVVAAAAAAAAQEVVLSSRRRNTGSAMSAADNDTPPTQDMPIAPSTLQEHAASIQPLENIATAEVFCPAAGSTNQLPHPIPPAHICRCWRGTQPALEIDWGRFNIDSVPVVDEPFLCTRCEQHWTHRSGGCSMMKGFPWILPSMEKDYMCFACWSSLAHDVREIYENYFFKKHAAKFGLVEVPINVQKYMDMHEEIVGWKWENNRWVERR